MLEKCMISVSEALSLISENKPRFQSVSQRVDSCLGMTASADVTAKVTMPPFNASAMDGYAVRLADLLADSNHLALGPDVAGLDRH